MLKIYCMLKIILVICILSNKVCGQENKKIKLVIGSNISNPHHLLENTKSHTDISNGSAFGSLYLGMIFKNRLQLNLITELNEFRGLNSINTDIIISVRYYYFNKLNSLKPYIELGTIVNSNGVVMNNVKNQKSLCSELGLIYKLNKIVNLSFSFNYQVRKMELDYSKYDFMETLNTNRTMFKTGLQINLN